MKKTSPIRFFKQQPKTLFISSLLALGLGACTNKNSSDNTLRIPMIADATSLDPAFAETRYTAIAVGQVYESLLEYEYLVRPHTLKPLLASEMPTVSKDGLTYTFKLKKGAKFTDHEAFAGGKGRAVVAKDFVYSFLRICDPKLNSPGYWIFDGHIKGIAEWRKAQEKAAKVDYDNAPEGFKAIDDETLAITVTKPYPQLLFVLAMPYGHVVPREVVEKVGPDFNNNPVGTGPFKFVKWTRNSTIEYVKNPDWHGQTYPSVGDEDAKAQGLLADAGKPLPFADKLELKVFVESQPMWLNFMSGQIDMTSIPKDNYKAAINPETRDLVADLKAKGLGLTKEPEPDLVYISFNHEDPVIKKGGANLRKAISLAMNKQKVIDIFRNGRALIAQTLVPPGLAGYDAAFVSPYSKYDIEEAKKYLAKAGFPEGKGLPEINYETSNGSDSRQLSENLQKELEVIGVKLRVNLNTFSELSTKLNTKKAQMWGIAWGADYPDAENFLQLIYGPNKSPGPNAANYDNPKYNALFDKMKQMQDSPERRKIIRQMLDIFVEDLPFVPESHRITYELQQPWFKNYRAGYIGVPHPAKFYKVDVERKAQGLK